MQVETVNLLVTLFKHYDKLDKDRVKSYAMILDDIPSKELAIVTHKVMCEEEFLPTTAKIRRIHNSLFPRTLTKGWDEAWVEINHKIRCSPVDKEPEWSTKEIALTVRNFGWKDLVCSEISRLEIIRAQMRDFYKDICAREKEKQTNQMYLIQGGYKQLGVSNDSNRT